MFAPLSKIACAAKGPWFMNWPFVLTRAAEYFEAHDPHTHITLAKALGAIVGTEAPHNFRKSH